MPPRSADLQEGPGSGEEGTNLAQDGPNRPRKFLVRWTSESEWKLKGCPGPKVTPRRPHDHSIMAPRWRQPAPDKFSFRWTS
eukprot:8766775-Karenia_brevis.AAC.1